MQGQRRLRREIEKNNESERATAVHPARRGNKLFPLARDNYAHHRREFLALHRTGGCARVLRLKHSGDHAHSYTDFFGTNAMQFYRIKAARP